MNDVLLAYEWDFKVILDHLPALLHGVGITFEFAILAMLLSIAVGMVLAVAAEFGPLPIRVLAIVYTEFFRALPVLVLLFWFFLALPLVTGWLLSPFASAILALVLNASAFVGEAFRSGMSSVSKGQREAGLALGMRPLQMAWRIVWPQGWRRTLPIVGSIWVGLFKDSSLVSLVEVHDLMFEGRVIANTYYRYFEAYTAVAVLYFLLAYPQARLVDWLFKRHRTAE